MSRAPQRPQGAFGDHRGSSTRRPCAVASLIQAARQVWKSATFESILWMLCALWAGKTKK